MGTITDKYIATKQTSVQLYYPDTIWPFPSIFSIKKGQPTVNSVNRMLLKFPDMPPEPGPPATIISAKILFYVQGQTVGSNPPATIDCYDSGNFDFATTTWNNQPALGAIRGQKTWPPGTGYLEIDITSYIQALGWAGGALEFTFKLNNEGSTGANGISIESLIHAGVEPYLELVFSDDAPTPSVCTLAPQAADKEKNTVNWTLNPDTDFAKYEIWKRINGGTWALVHTELTQATVTWDDPAVLADGSLYEYYVRTYDGVGQTVDSNIAAHTQPDVLDFVINNLTPTVGQTVTGFITATSGLPLAQWFYDWDDGTQEWIASASRDHDYLAAGTYNTKCRVRDTGGWESTLFTGPTVNVQSQAPIPKIHAYPQRADIGETVVLNMSQSFDPDLTGGIDKYEFDLGTGVFTIDNGGNPIYYWVPSSYGTKTIRGRVTDTDTDTAIAEVTVIVAAISIIELAFNWDVNQLDREGELQLDSASKFSRKGTDSQPTGSGPILIKIGASVQGDDGEDDIRLLESIRDNPDLSGSMVKIYMDGYYYVGWLRNISIQKTRGAPPKTWRWSADLEIPEAPIA